VRPSALLLERIGLRLILLIAEHRIYYIFQVLVREVRFFRRSIWQWQSETSAAIGLRGFARRWSGPATLPRPR